MNGEATTTSTVVVDDEEETGEEMTSGTRHRGGGGLTVSTDDLRYDEYLFPTIPEPLDTLRGMTSRDAEIRSVVRIQVSHFYSCKEFNGYPLFPI